MSGDSKTLWIYISVIMLSCLLGMVANRYNRRIFYADNNIDGEDYDYKRNRKWELIWVIISAIPLILLAALRLNTGADYLQYTWNYSKIVTDPAFGVAITASEPGYMLSMWICTKVFGNNPQWWIAIMSILTIGIIYTTLFRLRTRISYPLFTVMFGFYAYLHSFNYVRQMLAAALLFMAFERLHNKHTLQSVIIAILAVTFHRSSIIIALLFLLGRLLKNYKSIYNFVAITGLSGIVVAFPRIMPLIPFLSRYAKYAEVAFSGGAGWIIDIIPLIICIPLSLNMRNDDTVSDCIQLLLFSIPVRLMSYYTYAVGRLFITISLYAFLCAALSTDSRRDRVIVRLIYLIVYGAYFYWYFYLGNNSMVFPYNSII